MSHDVSNVFAWSETDPDDRLSGMVAKLSEADGPADESGAWPERLWSILTESGATLWTLPRRLGGVECDRSTLIERYARVAQGSLTAAFILTQHDAGVRRLLASADRPAAAHWLESIASGEAFTTVGISQLTTSRRHGAQALIATEREGSGFTLDGAMPWVTAASRADVIVTGAVLGDERQLLLAVPTDRPGIRVLPPFELAALQASCTSEVSCGGVPVSETDVLAGPVHDVMSQAGSGGTGGLETSALALGLARAALDALGAEAPRRSELVEPVEALSEEWKRLWRSLDAAARGSGDSPAPGQVRSQANALVLRTTQAYLTARKGTGFLRSEPAQRWAREALFFLVWSCPSPVAQAAIRDLAGLCSA